MRFTGLCLITESVATLSSFYEKILATTANGNDIHAELDVDGCYLAIYARNAANTDMGFSLNAVYGTGNTTLMFSVDDVDEEYRRLKPLVDRFITQPTTYPWGTRAFHFYDPDGNIVDFVNKQVE